MESYTKKFDKLRIKLEYILSATNNFGSDKRIAVGGFGPVYKGELPRPMGGTITVAIKRLNRENGQGNTQFWQEIMILHSYEHPNLVSLLHFCDEGGERILVYKFVSGGSLDRHLNSYSLTWDKRLKVCFGVAKALQYLHDPKEGYQRAIHRDIKSGNILVDETWFPKLSDFGLSRMGPANQVQSAVFTNSVGTPGYISPEYAATGFLVKEADVYSFGVVMFELMCGRLCCEYKNGQVSHDYVPLWKQCTDEKREDVIVFNGLKKHTGSASFMTFSSIARRCVRTNPKERPTMPEIVQWLDYALRQHNMDRRSINVSQDLINYVKRTLPFYSNKSTEELIWLMSKGILLDSGVTWLSLNRSGGLCVMISAVLCIPSSFCMYSSRRLNSRFPHVMAGNLNTGFTLVGSTNYLKPGVMYNVNLVFKHSKMNISKHIPFKYRVNSTVIMDSTGTHLREDGWLMTRLHQFTSQRQCYPNFKIEFFPIYERPGNAMLCFYCEGIEFQPVEH